MKAIRENKKYRLVSGIGQYMNNRYEIQERYKYYENCNWIYSWHVIFHSVELKNCIEIWDKRYNTIE